MKPADPGEAWRTAMELQALAIDYWFDVDHHWGAAAHDYYLEDGTFAIGDRIFRGRSEIRQFYAWRRGRGARVARHCITNFRILATSEDAVEAISLLTLYAADGAPILPSTPPIQISDVFERCRRDADGRWKYVSRRLVPLFEGTTPVTVPSQ
ncbi:MAG: hypothetical protein KIT16_00840 [Rhodospirillaceae bacterium]|nr:hypothetical protein [Rhodospirillaceae bacterium]